MTGEGWTEEKALIYKQGLDDGIEMGKEVFGTVLRKELQDLVPHKMVYLDKADVLAIIDKYTKGAE